MGAKSNQPSFLLTSPVTRSWRWHKQWIHQHTYEQGFWVMHIGKPIKRHWHPLHARVSHYQQSIYMRSGFSTSHQYLDAVWYYGQKWKLSNNHNGSVYVESACEWHPHSCLLSVVSSTSNCVMNIYDNKISLLHACKGRGPHLPSYPSGNLKVV